MDLAERGKAAAGQALDDVHLPEGPVAIERFGHERGAELFELRVAPRPRQARVPYVVVEVEIRVVDPDRTLCERNPGDLPPIARHPVQFRGNQIPDRVGVDAAVGSLQIAGVEGERRRQMHRCGLLLEPEEGFVQAPSDSYVAPSGCSPEVRA